MREIGQTSQPASQPGQKTQQTNTFLKGTGNARRSPSQAATCYKYKTYTGVILDIGGTKRTFIRIALIL